jgi:uroporphyrinogen decarboxylase
MNIFKSALLRKNFERPPVWLMRQAGRYHSHYQNLRRRHSFMELCKKPELACEVALGPIRDFDFDAAILFSDLLFPLEAMGMGLHYDDKPRLDWYLRKPEDLKNLRSGKQLSEGLFFQARALELTRAALDPRKGLLGFVGGPLTLYSYAVEGTHQGDFVSVHQGLNDGRYEGFWEKLSDLLVENMVLQAQAGADAIAVLDTCAGKFDQAIFQTKVVPCLADLLSKFKTRCPDHCVIYYSKDTQRNHWDSLRELPIDCLGIDWKNDLSQTLQEEAPYWSIQGNSDPHWLLLELNDFEDRLRTSFLKVRELPRNILQGWVCGLGHGVLPNATEEHVRSFVRIQKEIFEDWS